MNTRLSAGRLLLLTVSIAGLAGCAQDLTVRRVRTAQRGSSTPPEPGASLRTLARTVPGGPPPTEADAQRRAATELLDLYGAAMLAAPRHAVRVPGEGGKPVTLRLLRGDGPGGLEPGRFQRLEPTDDFAVKSSVGVVVTPGEGVSLAGTLRPTLPAAVSGPVPPQPVPGRVWAVTAVPRFRPAGEGAESEGRLDFELYDPQTTGHRPGASRPLAGDYTTPLALTLAHLGPQQRGWRGFLSGRDFSSAGLYQTEKPTPDKTPLVLVHGLLSSPPDWQALYVRLMSDPAVRLRYQIWLFYYPSSLPVPYTTLLLREDLEKLLRRLDPAGVHPPLHRIVLVGHSMGGLLCRLAVSDGGDTYYHHFFRRPPDQLHLTPTDRDLIRRAFYGRACADVSRVVFIATPHRGSKLAGGLLGNVGRLLVHMPQAVRKRLARILADNPAALAPGTPLKPGSSLDSLTPRDPVIAAVNDLPMRREVALHSIIGNRGRAGPLEDSSDGVVPYTSSHLPQARSEVVVPAGHSGTLKCPQTAAEAARILHESETP